MLEIVVNDEALLKEVSFNYDELKTELEQRLDKYNSLVVTEDAIIAAKADRASLNNLADVLNSKGIEIKKRLMGGFDVKLKELVGLIKSASKSIDDQVKNFENQEKAEKEKTILDIYNNIIGDYADVLPFARVFNDKMLNKGSSLKKITEEITAKVNQTRSDLSIIDTLKVSDDIVLAVKDYYLRTLDLSGALAEKARLENIKGAIAAKVVTPTQAPEQVSTPAIESPLPVSESTDPVADEQIDFRVWVNPEQKAALKAFLVANNIKFGKVG